MAARLPAVTSRGHAVFRLLKMKPSNRRQPCRHHTVPVNTCYLPLSPSPLRSFLPPTAPPSSPTPQPPTFFPSYQYYLKSVFHFTKDQYAQIFLVIGGTSFVSQVNSISPRVPTPAYHCK